MSTSISPSTFVPQSSFSHAAYTMLPRALSPPPNLTVNSCLCCLEQRHVISSGSYFSHFSSTQVVLPKPRVCLLIYLVMCRFWPSSPLLSRPRFLPGSLISGDSRWVNDTRTHANVGDVLYLYPIKLRVPNWVVRFSKMLTLAKI